LQFRCTVLAEGVQSETYHPGMKKPAKVLVLATSLALAGGLVAFRAWSASSEAPPPASPPATPAAAPAPDAKPATVPAKPAAKRSDYFPGSKSALPIDWNDVEKATSPAAPTPPAK
jgi:hypothetical protein